MIKIKLLKTLEEITKHEKVTGKRHSIVDDFKRRVYEFPSEYAFTMTSVHKVGINPGTQFNTPAGVYCYPLDYQRYMQLMEDTLPYVSKAPYIGLIKLNMKDKKKWLIFEESGADNSTNEDVEEVLHKLDLMGMDVRDIYYFAENYGKHWYLGNSAKIWDILYFATDPKYFKQTKTKYQAPKNYRTVMWNSLLRKLGYIGIYDDGRGIVHENEPTQVVCLEPSAYELVDIYETAALRKETAKVLGVGELKKQESFEKKERIKYWKEFAKLPPDQKIFDTDDNFDLRTFIDEFKDIHILDNAIIRTGTYSDQSGRARVIGLAGDGYELPKNFKIKGTFTLFLGPSSSQQKFDNIEVETLEIRGGGLLPQGIKFKNLNINMGISKTVLPEGLDVEGDLIISPHIIKYLPENLTVGGTLFVTDPINRVQDFFPENFQVGKFTGDLAQARFVTGGEYINPKQHKIDDERLKHIIKKIKEALHLPSKPAPQKQSDIFKQPDLNDFDF